MPLEFKSLDETNRLLIEAELSPLQGPRFQPTGFPHLGAATYKAPDGTDMLLVESAQSVANRMEAVCWDSVCDDWVEPLRGLPVVKVVDNDGKPLTNSVLEAHRLNSPYIKNSDWFETLKGEIGYDDNRPIDMRCTVYPNLLKYDPNSLLHGIFISLKKTAGVRSSRALSGFVEATNVAVASSGGVKNDRVDVTGKIVDGGATEGYGNVLFPRDEYTARQISAYFNLDVAQIRAFGLGREAEQLLIALALFKIRKFLAEGLRLRTACDLGLDAFNVIKPAGFTCPELSELKEELPALIINVANKALFSRPAVTTVTWLSKSRKAKNKSDKESAGDDGADAA